MPVLKRGARLFAAFVVFAAVVEVIAFFASPPLNYMAARTVVFLLNPVLAVRPWEPDPSGDPILFVHYYWGMEAYVAALLAYFVVCLALAWCWSWIDARAKRT